VPERFLKKEGPFVHAGFHTNPANSAIVRVDEGKPHSLTRSNRINGGKSERGQAAFFDHNASPPSSGYRGMNRSCAKRSKRVVTR
jgi:hypothetical protein